MFDSGATFKATIGLSLDYGATSAGSNSPSPASAGGQPSWITAAGVDTWSGADMWFDPINSGHVIFLTGIAVYDAVPTATSNPAATYNNITAGVVESLVVQQIA